MLLIASQRYEKRQEYISCVCLLMGIRAKQIVVHGLVQGVGFRYFTQRAGTRMQLVGSVRNCRDRTVEIIVEGEERSIDEFIRVMEKGPAGAQVEKLEIREIKPSGTYRTFLIEG
jgi:acylphosphatase